MNKPLFALVGLLGIASPLLAQPTVNRPLRVPKGTIVSPQGTPQLDVKPTQIGGPVSVDLMANLQKMDERIQALETQNTELKKRIATLEADQSKIAKDVFQHGKDMISLRLIVPAMDKAINKTNGDLAAFKSDMATFKLEYSKHSHKTNFSYESFKFLTETPGNNKGNFYIPYVWLNSKPGLNQIEKEQSVQPYLNKTTPPTDK